jgi:hypothetical protein
MSPPDDLVARARALAAAHPDIAMVLHYLPVEGGADPEPRVGLVMRDGEAVPWVAPARGIEGMTWDHIPGRARIGEILADQRTAGWRVYLNYCDARAIILVVQDGRERIAVDEIAERKYRILHPEAGRVPPLPEFFHLWGGPTDGPRGPAR